MMVIVTGAAGGLGRAMASECARRGYNLFLTDINQEQLERIRFGLSRRYDVNIYAKTCDLTSDESVKGLFAYICSLGETVSMLLNIAGVDYEGSFLARNSECINDIVQLNIAATLRITHALLAKRSIHPLYIINVSSLASIYPIPLKATYAASKRFILDFSIALGQELRHENVYVMALCPGGLATTKEALAGISSQGFWGSATTNRLESVARKTISRALSGRRVYIPGALNRMLSIAGKLIPGTWVARVLHGRWLAAQKKWLNITNI